MVTELASFPRFLHYAVVQVPQEEPSDGHLPWVRTPSTGTVTADPEVISHLSQFFEIPNAFEVNDLLRTPGFPLWLVFAAHEKLKEIFPNSAFRLDAFIDPAGTEPRHLIVGIRTRLAVEDALAKLGELDQRWWLGVAPLAAGQISIDLQFE